MATPSEVRTYSAVKDICPKIDLSVLGDWSYEIYRGPEDRLYTDAVHTVAGCTYWMRSPAGAEVLLSIEATFATKVPFVESVFDQRQADDKTLGYDDGQISGLGDRAYGASRDGRMDKLVFSEYRVNFLDGNLLLDTRISITDKDYAVKTELKDKTVAEARSVLSALS